jgi:hypothetical protein
MVLPSQGDNGLELERAKVPNQTARMATSANPIARKGHGQARNFERNRGMGPAVGQAGTREHRRGKEPQEGMSHPGQRSNA